WSPAEREKAVQSGMLSPFIPFEQFQAELLKASALLTVISFAPEVALLMQTNFPSKIITYLSFDKPLIVWAPPHSTAAKFIRKYDCGLLIDDPDPERFWERVRTFAASPEEQQRYRQNAVRVRDEVLRPDALQRRFVALVRSCVEGRAVDTH
ncbi:MAG: hypothetical protein WBA12_14475, partial [Catalinimonas sp.]